MLYYTGCSAVCGVWCECKCAESLSAHGESVSDKFVRVATCKDLGYLSDDCSHSSLRMYGHSYLEFFFSLITAFLFLNRIFAT